MGFGNDLTMIEGFLLWPVADAQFVQTAMKTKQYAMAIPALAGGAMMYLMWPGTGDLMELAKVYAYAGAASYGSMLLVGAYET